MLSFGFRGGIILGVLLLQSACSNGASLWTKPSMDPERRADDYAECRDETRQATQKDYAIDQDIAASRGNDWRNQGIYNQQTSNLTSGAADKSSEILSDCMASMGYEPVR